MSADLLANAERAPSERPAPSYDNHKDTTSGYWLGSATSQIEAWRRRALEAEAAVAELRRALGDWRPHT